MAYRHYFLLEVMIIACTRPLQAVWTGKYTDKGKRQYKITGNALEKPDPFGMTLTIPCGQCLECRMQYARTWADRCVLELQSHESSYFLTLTYDNEHVNWTDDYMHMTLRKKDLQDFHKRLRDRLDYPIRYYASGEYGDITKRPHYHDIVFGLKIDDLEFDSRTDQGHILYKSAFLDDVWQHGKVIIGEVTWESCAYTARYVTKKHKGLDSSLYEAFGIEPEFVLMSRKPGIGKTYYETHPDMFKYGEVYIKTKDGGIKVKPSRYFEKLLEADNPELLDSYKEQKALVGKIVAADKLSQTDLEFYDNLGVQEELKAKKLKVFERSQI